MIVDYSIDSFAVAIRELLQGPIFPGREFVRGGATFAEVYAMAANLQMTLADRRLPDEAVCLAVENKAIVAAALLASLAGGPPLLLPYAFSANALAQLQQTTGYTTAIADSPREFPAGIQVLCPQANETGRLTVNGQPSLRGELLKIFTGGSTGTPQVWSKTRMNMLSEGLVLAKYFAVTKDDCILATIPPYHIYGLLFSVLLPLVAGAAVVDESPSFPNEIVLLAERHRVTHLVSVPAHYRVLGDRQMAIRLAFSSAGMLDAEDNRHFYSNNPAGIVEVYGSTETGGIATRNRSQGEEFFTPFPTVAWKIADSRLALTSPYLSPELPLDRDGYFTINDRVEAKGPGQFALKGRTDTVTKVGGKRVDLGEISALIKKEAGVVDCVVIALPEAGGRGNRIGALVQGEHADTDAIRKMLADSLEPYALPRLLKKVERIPLSQNGKYDWTAIVQLLQK
ncbi:MAG: AMP-binding protein [Desulforhopalus sp.]|nr:AMP-binding protein [Desulforhopalus sp.]